MVHTSMKPDVLIVGSRGMTGIRRALQGSTSKEIVSRSDCATLVVRATAFVAPHDAPPFRLHSSGAPQRLPQARSPHHNTPARRLYAHASGIPGDGRRRRTCGACGFAAAAPRRW